MQDSLEDLSVAAVACAGESVWALSDEDLVGRLDRLHRAEQSVAAAKAHVVRQIDVRGAAGPLGRQKIAGWLQQRLRVDAGAARRLVEVAEVVDRFARVDQAYSAGEMHTRQVEAVGEALDDLPADIGAEITGRAEKALVELAGVHAPYPLRVLGSRILAHVAPELADADEEAALRREEQRARRQRGFTLGMPVAGAVRLFGLLPTEDAAVVRAALDPLCVPRADDGRTPTQRRADALVDVCRLALSSGKLPDSGGERPQLSVSVSYDAVTGELRRARLDSGELLSAEAARRVACDAQVLPIVLGGSGQILDVGRARRVATGALRRAVVARDFGCAFPGCDRPARWCSAHHIKHWVDGGTTDLDNLVLLCGHHHRLIHEGEWEARLGPDKLPEFIPPAHIDASRTARRNIFHHRE